jgi:hypothetical protein
MKKLSFLLEKSFFCFRLMKVQFSYLGTRRQFLTISVHHSYCHGWAVITSLPPMVEWWSPCHTACIPGSTLPTLTLTLKIAAISHPEYLHTPTRLHGVKPTSESFTLCSEISNTISYCCFVTAFICAFNHLNLKVWILTTLTTDRSLILLQAINTLLQLEPMRNANGMISKAGIRITRVVVNSGWSRVILCQGAAYTHI